MSWIEYISNFNTTDYQLSNELSIIKTIYSDTFHYDENTQTINLTLTSSDTFQNTDYTALITLNIQITFDYPFTPPHLEITNSQNIDEKLINSTLNKLNKSLKKIRGIPMLFEIAITFQEAINKSVELLLTRIKSNAALLDTPREETCITLDSADIIPFSTDAFYEWLAKFESEQQILTTKSNKITGRQFFESKKLQKDDLNAIPPLLNDDEEDDDDINENI